MCSKHSGAPPLRIALADVLHHHLAVNGSDGLEMLYHELGCADRDSVWTRRRVDRALDDLATSGRVTINARGGWIDIEAVIDDDMWAELEGEAPTSFAQITV